MIRKSVLVLISILGNVEYCGCYWNDQRHGFGMLFDRKGELVYQGGFVFGRNVYETIVTVKSIESDKIVNCFTHEFVIGEGCGNRLSTSISRRKVAS